MTDRARRAWQALALPLGIYLATRLVQVLLVWWMVPERTFDAATSRLTSWDVGWFVRVAQEGYPAGYTYDEQGHVAANGLAFFPGYPLLVRLGQAVTGASFESAALIVSWLVGVVAALLVYALGARLYDRRVGIALLALFSTQPMAVVLSMGYSEGLFVVFAAGALLAAHRGSWLAAGALGLGAALTRPIGAAVGVALAVAALLEVRAIARARASAADPPGKLAAPAAPAAPAVGGPVVGAPAGSVAGNPADEPAGAESAAGAPAIDESTAGGSTPDAVAAEPSGGATGAGSDVDRPRTAAGSAATRPGSPANPWVPVLAALVALAGTPAYLLWVGVRAGSLSAWFDIQTAGWGTSFDFGGAVIAFLGNAFKSEGWVEVSVSWIVLAALLLGGLAVLRGVWPPLLVYGLLTLVAVLGQAGFYHSKPRLLVPVLAILVPMALALGRARPSTAIAVLVGTGLFGLWYGSYLITVWPFAI